MNVSTDVLTNAATLALQGQIGKTRATRGFIEQVFPIQNLGTSTCSTRYPEAEGNIDCLKRSLLSAHRAAASYSEPFSAEVGQILHTMSHSSASKLARTVKH